MLGQFYLRNLQQNQIIIKSKDLIQMQGHFNFGFTIQDTQTNRKLKNQKKSQQIQNQNHNPVEISDEESSEMLFMIGTKAIAQKNEEIIDIEESCQSIDSDKTIDLRKQKEKHRKKHKKKDKKNKQHKKDRKSSQDEQSEIRHKNEKRKLERQKSDKQQGQLREEKQRPKKQKKIKKNKQKHKNKLQQKFQSNYSDQEKRQPKPIHKQQNKTSKISSQDSENQLFPSLLQKKPIKYSQQTQLIPLPSYLKTSDDSSKELYNSYLQKLSDSSLLPSRTIKQLSSSIVQKNEEFSFLYKSDQQRFDKQASLDFFTNSKFPDYLNCDLKFDIIRFPIKELYTYGKHMDKDIPKYYLVQNYNKVIGVKQKKQHKYEKMMRQIYRSLNQQDFSYKLKNTRDRGGFDRYFHYQGYENLSGVENLVQKREKLRYLKSKNRTLEQSNQVSRSNKNFIAFEQLAKSFSVDRQLSMLQSSRQQKFKDENRNLTQELVNKPHDIQLWLKLINLQDDLSTLNIFTFSSTTDKSSESKSMKISSFVIEKKLSIFRKALKENPYNQTLGEVFFKLLFLYLRHQQTKMEELSQQLDSIEKIVEELLHYIQKYQTNSTFWLLYLQLKLQIQPIISFSSMTTSHTYLKQVFSQISGLIGKMTENERSAQQIKKLRSISLMILQKIMDFYRKQGYVELSLGIGIALIEFNLFVPQRVYNKFSRQSQLEEKKKQFMRYWEQYKQERIGDLAWRERRSWEIWDSQKQTIQMHKIDTIFSDNVINPPEVKQKKKQQSLTYIEKSIPLNNPPSQKEPISTSQQQLQAESHSWHFASPLYNKQRIKQSIDSLVLYEDIQRWLLNIRDTDNIVNLVQMVVNQGLGMKSVFGDREISGNKCRQFDMFVNSKAVQVMQVCSFGGENSVWSSAQMYWYQKSNVYSASLNLGNQLNDQLFEQHYWPPELTLSFLCHSIDNHQAKSSRKYEFSFLKKVIYISRLLRVVSQKLIPALIHQKNLNHIYRLHQYRLFLLGCMRLVRVQLMNMEQEHKKQLQNIMESYDDIRQEIKEIIGWFQENRSNLEKTNIQNPNQAQTRYDQTKLWAMYIQFEWMIVSQGNILIKNENVDKLNQSNSVNKVKEILLESISIYYQLLLTQTQAFLQGNILNLLLTLRFYFMFLEGIISQNYQMKDRLKTHAMKLISEVVRCRRENCLNAAEDVTKQIQKFKEELITYISFNSHSQGTTSNQFVISAIHRLELIGSVSQIYTQINEFLKQSNLSYQQSLRYRLILVWLNDLVIQYDNLSLTVDQDLQLEKSWSNLNQQNQSSFAAQKQADVQSSNKNKQKFMKLSQVMKERVLKIRYNLLEYFKLNQQKINNSNDLSSINSESKKRLHTFLKSTLNKAIIVYRIWNYLQQKLQKNSKKAYSDRNDKFDCSYEQNKSMNSLTHNYENLLLKLVRNLQEIYTIIKEQRFKAKQNVNLRLISRDSDQLYWSKLLQQYHKGVSFLKNYTHQTAKSSQKAFKDNKNESNSINSQEQSTLLSVQLVLTQLKQISQSNYSQLQQTNLKQVIYPLLSKYPYCKKLYLHYLSLIEEQIKRIKPENIQNVKKIDDLEDEIEVIYDKMKVHGIRLIRIRPNIQKMRD